MRKGCPIPAEEMREAMKVLKLLTMAHHQLARGSVSSGVDSAASMVNSSRTSRKVSRVKDATVLFHQLMLSDLRERVEKLDTRWDTQEPYMQNYIYTRTVIHTERQKSTDTHMHTLSSIYRPSCML